jgi:hypothetical protein
MSNDLYHNIVTNSARPGDETRPLEIRLMMDFEGVIDVVHFIIWGMCDVHKIKNKIKLHGRQ